MLSEAAMAKLGLRPGLVFANKVQREKRPPKGFPFTRLRDNLFLPAWGD